MHDSLPLTMLIVFAGAKLLAEIFERLGLPGIVGEITAGILVGPSVLAWVAPNATLAALADIGVMFLLFRVGLEVKASELMRVGPTAALVATIGVIVPQFLGWALMRLWGYGQIESIFVGAALVATSVGITAQVLSAKGVLHLRSSQIILAAAVIDDVLGLIILAVVSGMAKGEFQFIEVAIAAVLALGFTWVAAHYGTRTAKRAMPAMQSKLRAGEAQFHLALVLLFALSVLAMYTGVAAIVGAFLAGMSLGESVTQRVHDLAQGTTELLVPFFLAGIGLKIDLSVFKDYSALLLTALVLLVAIVSKLIGCSAGALGLGMKDATRIGVGMIPRGEVGMVVAQLGLSMGAISKTVYGIVVFTSLATTVVAPGLLSLAYRDATVPEADLDSLADGAGV